MRHEREGSLICTEVFSNHDHPMHDEQGEISSVKVAVAGPTFSGGRSSILSVILLSFCWFYREVC